MNIWIVGMLRFELAGRKPRGRLKMKPERPDPSRARQCQLKCIISQSLEEDLKFCFCFVVVVFLNSRHMGQF